MTPSGSCSTTRALRRARTSAPSSCPKPRSAPSRPCLRRLLGARGCGRAPSARTAPGTPPLRTLIARDLLLDQLLDEPRELRVEELRHALLVAADTPCELGRLGIADLLRQRLEPRVQSDLDVLLAELLLRIAEMRLRLTRDQCPCRPDLALDSGDRLAGRLPDDVRHGGLRGYGHGCRLAAQLLDPPRDRALVVAGLSQVPLEALLVRSLLGQLDVRGEIGLELGLLRMRLVQPLNELRLTFVHGSPFLGWVSAPDYPRLRV